MAATAISIELEISGDFEQVETDDAKRAVIFQEVANFMKADMMRRMGLDASHVEVFVSDDFDETTFDMMVSDDEDDPDGGRTALCEQVNEAIERGFEAWQSQS